MAVLFVRDAGGQHVIEQVREVAKALRRRFPGQRVSDADVARQLLLAALGTPAILRRLGMNGRGDRDSSTPQRSAS